MLFSGWISRRLSLDTGGSRTGIAVAVAGVALAVIVLEFTLAIVTGFKHEIQRKLSGFDAQTTVLPPFLPGEGTQQDGISMDAGLLGIITENIPAHATVSLAIRQPGILKTDSDFEGVVFEARDARNADFSFERGNIVRGVWPDYASDSCATHLVISTTTAERLGLDVGQRIFSTFIVDEAVKVRRHTIAGLYRSDFGEYDRQVVYTSLPLLQSVAGMDSTGGNRIDIRGLDESEIDDVGYVLQNALLSAAATGRIGSYYPVSTVHQSGALYYNWLALLDTNVAVIFILMLCVAGFTLVSSLFILILERVRTIGVLRALGATRSEVRNIFVLLTLKVVGIGMIIGNIIGIGLLMAQSTWHTVKLNPEMYYLSSVPVEINPWHIIALNAGVIIAAYLILVVPAGMAARIPPAEAARFD